LLYDDLDLFQAVEDFAVQQLFPGKSQG
jgi:hypothetical protein